MSYTGLRLRISPVILYSAWIPSSSLSAPQSRGHRDTGCNYRSVLLAKRFSCEFPPAALAPPSHVDIEIQAVITDLFYWPNDLAVNSRRQRSWRPELLYVAVSSAQRIVRSSVPSRGVFIYGGE